VETVRVKKTRQIRNPEPRFDAVETGLWREPTNSEASADVRCGAHSGLRSDIAQGPKSQEQTHAPHQLAASLDHLVGTGEKRRRHRYADCLGSLYIDDELKFGRGLHRKVGRVGPAQYQTDIGYCLLDQLV